MANTVQFFVNGQLVELTDPSPQLLLLDYLRSPEVALTGAKKGCGQGGCGACTVILSTWDPEAGRVQHRAINSCLRPVCALGGVAITTIEGTGRVEPRMAPHLNHAPTFSRAGVRPEHETPPGIAAARAAHADHRAALAAANEGPLADVNPVAYRLAANNGTQCGYCTPGFVMCMSAFLADNPERTKREIQDELDGNICRCTGYRPILTGFETFATDWTPGDEAHRMKCLLEDGKIAPDPPGPVSIPFPDGAKSGPQPVDLDARGIEWRTPTTMEELLGLLGQSPEVKTRLVHGNTSYGVYPLEFPDVRRFVDVRLVPELHGTSFDANAVDLGAGTTYAQLIETLGGIMGLRSPSETSPLGATQFMARRTAGSIVRNAASMGGNSMLVLAHIHDGEPFPSDVMTALVAIGAEVTWADVRTGTTTRGPVDDLVSGIEGGALAAGDVLLVRYHLPIGSDADIVLAQKTALREVNAHSIVNATTRLSIPKDIVDQAAVVFGGIAPYPWHASRTEALLVGKPLSLDAFPTLGAALRLEAQAALDAWAGRRRALPDEGFTDEFRIELAVAFLYKAVVNALMQRDPGAVPPAVRSSGEITWGHWPVITGRQFYETRSWEAPVNEPYIKLEAFYQASGQIHYTHELPPPPTTVNAAFVQSLRPLATFDWTVPGTPGPADLGAVDAHLRARFPAYVALVTVADLPPGGMNLQGMGADQPLFATGQVSYVGQALALAVAETEQDAIDIAAYVTASCVSYGPVAWPAPWDQPVLSLEQAIEMGSVFPDCPTTASYVSHVWRVTRPRSTFGWTAARPPLDRGHGRHRSEIDGAECEVVSGSARTGGQVHFYMETQACLATPVDGGRLLVNPSSQSPMEMRQTVAMALAGEYNKIDVQIVQVGGGYGGKTEQARFVAGPTAVAAQKLGRPVRLVMPRDADTAMIGKRHPYLGQYQVAVDADGIIRGLKVALWGDGGAFYDCSFIVSNCIQLRTDNAYNIDNFQSQIDVCRTNTAPNTAMRAFGDIQGTVIVESAIDDAAVALGIEPEELRRRNMYLRGDVTPYGQALSYCYMRDVWDYMVEVSGLEQKKADAAAFNAANRWRKRGVYAIPVKYGSGYNFVQIEQAAAVVNVYSADGSITIHQGGVEMGQGLTTKVVQVAAYTLNVPMDLIQCELVKTSVIPNPSSTGASTGTAYNAEAARRACQVLRRRLTEFGYSLRDENGDAWCTAQGVDFWNYPTGWNTPVLTSGETVPKLIWQNLVGLAYAQRIGLVASFTAPIAGGETPVPALEYKAMEDQPQIPGIEVGPGPAGGAVDSFVGYTFSAACAEVEVDILTGEVQILSADLVYDTGWSLNPAIDVGQVEGAFIQGVGYLLSEWLVFQPDGEQQGTLNTTNTWTYKPPAVTSIPLSMNVRLFPRDLAADVPDDPNDLLSAKEVGEPPLVLATSVFFAIKEAVRASRVERGLDPLFTLDAPATVQEVRRACAVSAADLG